jgi:hypothetical protein
MNGNTETRPAFDPAALERYRNGCGRLFHDRTNCGPGRRCSACETALDALAEIQRLKADADANAPWLSLAHACCSAAGIAPSHIHSRISALFEKIIEYKDTERLNARLSDLLTGVANALKGPPDPLSTHSWHDLPEVAADIAGRVFKPHWPEGLNQQDIFRVMCDDKGRNEGSWLSVLIANDGDVHVGMQDWEDIPKGEPSPSPSIRIRTWSGGGRHSRTHQALLWLALAIKLDNAEFGLTNGGRRQKVKEALKP